MSAEHDEIVFDIIMNTGAAETSVRKLNMEIGQGIRALERFNGLIKDVLGVELPKLVTNAINRIESLILTVRSFQMMARSTLAMATFGVSLAVEAGVAAYEHFTAPPTETDKRVEG